MISLGIKSSETRTLHEKKFPVKKGNVLEGGMRLIAWLGWMYERDEKKKEEYTAWAAKESSAREGFKKETDAATTSS